jgi:hypothetical protein
MGRPSGSLHAADEEALGEACATGHWRLDDACDRDLLKLDIV